MNFKKLNFAKILFINLALINPAMASQTTFNCISASENQIGDQRILSFTLTPNGEHSSVKFKTDKNTLAYNDASADFEEDRAGKYLSVQHDDFSLILNIDDKQAVINPFIYEKNSYGPFYFLCK